MILRSNGTTAKVIADTTFFERCGMSFAGLNGLYPLHHCKSCPKLISSALSPSVGAIIKEFRGDFRVVAIARFVKRGRKCKDDLVFILIPRRPL